MGPLPSSRPVCTFIVVFVDVERSSCRRRRRCRCRCRRRRLSGTFEAQKEFFNLTTLEENHRIGCFSTT